MKRSTTSFKLFVMLIYGDYSFTHWTADRITIKSGPFCRFFHINPNRLKTYLAELEDNGLVFDVKRSFNNIEFNVALPVHIQNMGFTIDMLREGMKK